MAAVRGPVGGCPNPPEVAASVLGWVKAAPVGGAMSPLFGPTAHIATNAHHLYPHPDVREEGHFDLWAFTLFGFGGDEVASKVCWQRSSSSLPTAPLGDSTPRVWGVIPCLWPAHFSLRVSQVQPHRWANGTCQRPNTDGSLPNPGLGGPWVGRRWW